MAAGNDDGRWCRTYEGRAATVNREAVGSNGMAAFGKSLRTLGRFLGVIQEE